MKWDVREERWKKHYNLLKKYYKEFKTTNVPQSYVVDDIGLGIWLTSQRQFYKGKGKIRQEHIKLLNDLNVDWSPKDTKILNKEITNENIEEYSSILLNRLNSVLNDLIYEKINDINDSNTQEEITNILIKRIWR